MRTTTYSHLEKHRAEVLFYHLVFKPAVNWVIRAPLCRYRKSSLQKYYLNWGWERPSSISVVELGKTGEHRLVYKLI